MYLLVLYFDEASEQRIRGHWRDLAAAGLGDVGAHGYAPHLTLAAFEAAEIDALARRLEPLAASPALELSFEAVGAFCNSPTGSLHLSPVVTPALLSLHARSHDILRGVTRTANAHYLPGKWMPHCTLALELTLDQLALAFARFVPDFAPLRARTSSLALVEAGPPPKRLWQRSLR